MTSQIDAGPAYRLCAATCFYLSLGLVWVCEKEISHMGKNNGNSNLVCEKELSHMGKLTGNPDLVCKKIYSRTPVGDFCCFHPCEIKSFLHMYCCGTRKSHPRTRIIRQKRGSSEFLTKLFRSEGGISLSHNKTS